MNTICVSLLALASLLTCISARAHPALPKPDAHAPAGVMAEHVHARGEIMTAFRYQRSASNHLYHGGDRISISDLAAAGYSMTATDMTMEMFMLDIMYAPSDRLTLMLMPHYMRMDMAMAPTGLPVDDHAGEHQGQGHHGTHSVSGVGDTTFSALYELASGEQHQLVGTLGLSLPTGAADKRNPDGSFVHYGMQLGSGTWDLIPAVTYKGADGRLSWGAQLGAVLRLESKNASGYALGDRYKATTWSAWRVARWLSLSTRVEYEHEDEIDGHYNGPHGHASPSDIQANYGGEFFRAGIGANMVATHGAFAGLRLELEWVENIGQHYNGFQLGRDRGLNAVVSYAFK